MKYWDIFVEGYSGYVSYLWYEIIYLGWQNYFYWLFIVLGFFFLLEVVMFWCKDQLKFRKDFWLDFFYMFFNFFLFLFIIYNVVLDVIVNLFNDGIKVIIGGFDLQANNLLNGFFMWFILLVGFLVCDFVQWWVYWLLYCSDFFWEFYKVYYLVQQMGFVVYLCYYWMENVVYCLLEYILLVLLGIGFYDFFIIYIFILVVGYYNYFNIMVLGYVIGGVLGVLIGLVIVIGGFEINLLQDFFLVVQLGIVVGSIVFGVFVFGLFMKKFFNSLEMYIWYYFYDLLEEYCYGVNFGLMLVCWDYIFGIVYILFNGCDICLGFFGVEEFLEDFVS